MGPGRQRQGYSHSNQVRQLALMSCSLAEQWLDQLYRVREVQRSRLVVEV